MNRSLLMSGFLVVAFAFLLLTVRPVFAEYMAHADFSACPRKYIPRTSADEGPFATKPQCMARVDAARRGNNMSCARYSCEVVGGDGSTGSSGGTAGGSLQDLAIKNIAGGLGSGNANQFIGGIGAAAAAGILNDLFNGDKGQNVARQAERAAHAAEEAAAIARGQEREREIFQEQVRVRHEKILGSLKGGLGNTELGMKPYESGALELKTGSALFGKSPARETLQPGAGIVVVDGKGTGDIAIKMPDAPPVPEAKPIDQSKFDKVWADYTKATDDYAQADLRRQQLEDQKKLAERIRQEAEKKLAELKQQAAQRAAALPEEQPAMPEEDGKLAEAEKLLNQATDLDKKATQDLDKAQQDLKQAKLDLDRTEKERTKAEKSLAQAEQGQMKK